MFIIGYSRLSKLVPDSIKIILKSIINRFIFLIEMNSEIYRFKKFAYELNKKNDIHNLFARLTFHTHALEKGLSNSNLRKGFGQHAIKSLMEVMVEYKNAEYPLEEERFLSSLIVLKKYCRTHNNQPEYTDNIIKFLNSFSIDYPDLLVGAVEFQKETILKNSKSMFSDLALNRISVRDYSTVDVDDTYIFDSIKIAMKSPSVCNRQAWRIHLIKDVDLLERVLTLQGGFKGNGKNLKKLLLVTVDLRYFSNVHERNQGYIDGGIYLMSLVYALTYNGVATCILNAMFNIKREKEIRKAISLDESEIMIGFIALGNYPDVFKVPCSLRDSYEKCLKIH